MRLQHLVIALAFAGSAVTLMAEDKKPMPETKKEAVETKKEKVQTLCPVMNSEINKKLFVDVKGKRIYVCCPPCIKKIKADPDKYIKILEDQGVKIEDAPKSE